MTTATAHEVHQAPSPTGGGVRRLLLGPGLVRGAWMFVLFGAIGFGIVMPGLSESVPTRRFSFSIGPVAMALKSQP